MKKFNLLVHLPHYKRIVMAADPMPVDSDSDDQSEAGDSDDPDARPAQGPPE